MKTIQSVFTLSSVYIGTVIGAGFASGQEILQFFGVYGNRGIFGVILATILFSFLGSLLLRSIYKYKVVGFEQFSKMYFGKKHWEGISFLLIFLLLVGYFVMLAGSGAVVEEHFHIRRIHGILGMSVVCLGVFLLGVKGITKANNIVVPMLMVSIIGITMWVIMKNQLEFSNFYAGIANELQLLEKMRKGVSYKSFIFSHMEWLRSAFLYVSYNSIGVVVVMTALLPYIHNDKAAKYGGVLGGIGLGIMALFILLAILMLYTEVVGLEVPMVAIANFIGKRAKQIYSVILLLAMFTTAIANGYSCILRIAYLTKIHEGVVSFLVVGISIPLALLGFKKLVTFFYPLFGYLGFLLIIVIFLNQIKFRKICN